MLVPLAGTGKLYVCKMKDQFWCQVKTAGWVKGSPVVGGVGHKVHVCMYIPGGIAIVVVGICKGRLCTSWPILRFS